MTQTVLISGNPILTEDNRAIWLIPHLENHFPDIDFLIFDPTEEIINPDKKQLIIIDTIHGLRRVKLFDSLSCFKLSPRITAHDYDLPVNLGILLKLGKIKRVSIIGIPQKGNKKAILARVVKILKNPGNTR